ncbi:MAG: type II toxin-antitoxin system VapC family toxin [Saprospiraceae bacterium]
MKILLDTHIILWQITGDSRLRHENRAILASPAVEKTISVVSLWEIAIKVSIGKLTLAQKLTDIVPIGTLILPIRMPHLMQYQNLPLQHRDPFDRMLIAQAQAENLTLMSDDPNFPMHSVALII